MKKRCSLVLAAALTLGCLAGCSRFATTPSPSAESAPSATSGGQDVTINVYNWGQYIAEGDDDSIDVIDEFEKAYPNIHVNYTTYDSNETMYSKLKTGGISVDVIIPSDYMIARMIDEDMLLPLNFDNIPNYQYVDEAYRNTSYDPENQYSIPYTWGTVGIIYNTTMVEPGEDMETWDVLWNEKYAGDILMFDNPRDTIGIALKKLGYSYNTTDAAQITAAVDLLMEQKPLVQAYVMDDIFEKLEGGNAAIGVYYYGDFLTMYESNEDLAFALPREGTNRYVDAMCIPKGCENQENAEAFINFMCSTQAGLKNCEETWYSTPLLSVRKELDAEVVDDPFAYPDQDFMDNQCETFACLPAQIRTLYNDQWVRLMNN